MNRFLFALISILFLSACGNTFDTQQADDQADDSNQHGEEDLQEISVVLDWTPNTNHTGLYVAKEKGYFEDVGLDVDIILPGEAGPNQIVASGKSEFGVSYQEDVTEARIQDVPIVSIAAVIQHNTSGFASPVEKNITSPADFENKAFGGRGAPLEKAILESLMQEENADADKVDIVNTGETDFFTTVKRDIDFAWVFEGWTGVEAELRGEEMNMVYLTDYSDKLDYYTPVLTANETTIGDNPELVEDFLAAVTKGYQFSIDKPDKAANILIEAVPDLDPELVKASQEWLAPKFKDDASHWGEQKLSTWKNYADWMFDHELLDQELDAEAAFTNEFLPE